MTAAPLDADHCEAHDNVPPDSFTRRLRSHEAGALAASAPQLLSDLDLARSGPLGSPQAPRQFERWITSLHAQALLAREDWANEEDGTRGLVRGGADMEHENARVIRSFFGAFETEKYEPGVRDTVRSDVRWHVAGNHALAGEFVGVEAVLDAMRAFAERSNHTLRLETRSVFADARHGIAVHLATAQRDGLNYGTHEIDVFHIVDGLITEFWSFSEDQAATDALWS